MASNEIKSSYILEKILSGEERTDKTMMLMNKQDMVSLINYLLKENETLKKDIRNIETDFRTTINYYKSKLKEVN